MSANPSEYSEKQSAYPPSRLRGLIRFKPGQSGNPGGQKKGTVYVSECYKRLLCLSEAELREFKPANAAEAIALRQVLSGIYGLDALSSTKEITDRTEGKAPQKLDVSAQVAVTIDVSQIVGLLTQMLQLAPHNTPAQIVELARALPEAAELPGFEEAAAEWAASP